VPSVTALRGEGRWEEALAVLDDPLARADLLNEQALFQGSAEARRQAERELDRAEVLLLLGRGRILHARFLAERTGAEPYLRRIEAAQESLP
jgi:hypothetical protein